VFAACAADALGGRWERLDDYERLRHPLQRQVVDRIHAVTAFVRGRPDLVGGLRRFVLPGLAKFGPTAHLMARTLTGLDHDLKTEED
jgi:2-polyprenyl-6-methoxyphenol hydroxylase-like FAD-dependent oxidoreductase